ncbi:helix-turn-helix transcriptional regulator [Aliiroseovarius sp. YM-037]|uniref:helix-turn-helix transcriptional regulator n=1 Tax=Aliiroseovarius sp. YM-037 TaxID=3341728 RepID=UPI003A80F433
MRRGRGAGLAVGTGNHPGEQLFSALFVLCAVEALLVGLRFGYGVEALIPLQRTLPLFLGPLMYLGFAAMTVGKRGLLKRALFHLGAPVLVMTLFWLLVEDLRHLDWVISGSYLSYVIALFQLWRKGPDALIYARIDVTRSLSSWIVRGMGLFVFILVLDSAIALDFAMNRGANATALISYGTVPLILVLLAIVIALPPMLARSGSSAPPAPESGTDDAQIEAKVRTLMDEDQLFLDPNLTVQRLAKRLHLPARSVSGAINRARGMNVSQYVNEFRLAHASDLLVTSGESVTKIAEQSGFMARSNFYREFQRVYGQSPIEYRNACQTE